MTNVWRPAGAPTICFVSLLHTFQAFVLLLWPVAVLATPLYAIRDVLHALGWEGAHPYLIALILLVSSNVASYAAVAPRLRFRLWFFVPQNLLLAVMAVGGIVASTAGAYLDGTVIPWPHIAADQAPVFALLSAHTVAIARRCAESR